MGWDRARRGRGSTSGSSLKNPENSPARGQRWGTGMVVMAATVVSCEAVMRSDSQELWSGAGGPSTSLRSLGAGAVERRGSGGDKERRGIVTRLRRDRKGSEEV